MGGAQLRMRRSFPASHLLRRALDQFPVMIAANAGNPVANKHVAGKTRFQRAAETIAEIDDVLDAKTGDILQHGFKCCAVSVNIGNGGKDHGNQLPR